MAKLFELRFDAHTDEIETAYKAFQTRYTLKKRILYTFVYLIVLVLGVDLIVKNPTALPGYIASGLAAGILFFNWIKPITIRKKLVRTLSELDDETYIASFYEDRIEIETVIEKTEAETETVVLTASGVYPAEEGSPAAEAAAAEAATAEAAAEAASEAAEKAEKADEPIPKTVYRLSETELFFEEKDGLFLLFVNRSYIHTIPVRCLTEEQAARTREYFEDKLSIS